MRQTMGARAALYAPFLAFVVVVSVLMLAFPSVSRPTGRLAGASDELASGGGVTGPGGETAATAVGTVGGSTIPGGGAATGGGTAARGAAGGVAARGGTGTGAAAVTPCTSPSKTAANQELGIFCHPNFSGANGGSTMQGVTADTINIVYFEGAPDPVVNGVLSQKGLAATAEQEDAAIGAFTAWANKNWELYGRKIKVTRFVANCPIVSEDHDTCLASAREVVALKPFAVIYIMLFYADVFDLWANAGIPSFGGLWFDKSYYANLRPYRWDYFSNGTTIMDFAAEYYCKNMFGKPADHAGAVIYPSIGGRSTIRHLAIITRDDGELALNAEHLRSQVAACTGGKETPTLIATGSGGDNTQTTMTALTAKLINDKVTTVICQCEKVGSSIVSNYFSKESYFPEWLIAPMGGMDGDEAGQLADKQQWQHIVGLGQLWAPVPIGDTPASQAWHNTGHTGLACGASDCGAIFTYMALAGMGIQLAGPALTPLTLERGMFAARDLTPPGAAHGHFKLGPGTYNFLNDVRAIYWDPTKASPSNGDPGTYVEIDGGKRFALGGLPSDLVAKTPAPSS
jgi:hypothetical protein